MMLNRYLINFSGYGVMYLINLVSIPIIISLSSAKNYGEYVVLLSYLGILVAISPMGLGFMSKRDMPSSDTVNKRGEIFYPQFYTNIFFAFLLGYFFSIFFEIISPYIFDDKVMISRFLLISYSVSYVIYSQISFILKFSEKTISYNILGICNPLFFLIALIIIFNYQNELSIKSLLIAQIFSCLLNLVLFSYSCYKIVGFKLTFYNRKSLGHDFKYGLPLLFTVVAELLISSADRFIISLHMESQNVAFYSVAYTVASLILIIPKLFSISLEPRLMYLVDKNQNEELKDALKLSLSLYMFLCIPMIAGSFLYGSQALSIFIDASFAISSSKPLVVLMFGMFFHGLNILLISLLLAHKKTKDLLFVNAGAALVNLILNIVIFSFFKDIMVAAISSLISFILAFFLIRKSILRSRVGIKLTIFNSEFYKITTSVFLTSLFMKFVTVIQISPSIFSLLLNILIFLIVYLACLVIFQSHLIKSIYNKHIFDLNFKKNGNK